MSTAENSRALVVEGGAIRGIFASGVLDAFLNNNYLDFDFAICVSAGATNLIGYPCGNYGRSHKIIKEYFRDHEFLNFSRFIHGGHLTDIDWLWRTSTRHLPLNLNKYELCQIPLFATTTNLETGKAEHIEVTCNNVPPVMEATYTLPIAYRHSPTFNGIAMSDGGVADSILVIQAYRRGACDITVVLSKPFGFHKAETKVPWLIKPMFHDHSAFADTVIKRVQRYKLEQGYTMGKATGNRICVTPPLYGENCHRDLIKA